MTAEDRYYKSTEKELDYSVQRSVNKALVHRKNKI